MSPLSAQELINLAGAANASSQATTPDELNDVIQRACQLAKRIQQRAVELQTPAERRQQAELDRMLQHPEDKVTLTQMTDQGFRSRSPDRAVDQLIHILDVQGIPRFFSQLDRALLRGFQSFGNYLPAWLCRWSRTKCAKRPATSSCPLNPRCCAST